MNRLPERPGRDSRQGASRLAAACLSGSTCFTRSVSLVAHGLAHGLVIKNAFDQPVLGALAGVGLCCGCLGQCGLTLLGFRFQTSLFLKPGLFACRLAGFTRLGNPDAFLLPGLALRRGFLCGPVGLKKGGFCFRGRATAFGKFGLLDGSQISVPGVGYVNAGPGLACPGRVGMSWPLGLLPVPGKPGIAQPFGLLDLDSLARVSLFKRPLARGGGRDGLAEMTFSLLARRLVVRHHAVLARGKQKRPGKLPDLNFEMPCQQISVPHPTRARLLLMQLAGCWPTSCPTCGRAPCHRTASGLRRVRPSPSVRRPKYGRMRPGRRYRAG